MNDLQFLKLRDGNVHNVGPLSLRFIGIGPNDGPEGECFIRTEEGESFSLDWLYAEAIAFCIAPTADFWIAYDSDKEVQKNGENRGWLRLEVRTDFQRYEVGDLAGKAFPIARLITDAGIGEAAEHVDGGRSTDYRRETLRKKGKASRIESRRAFVAACERLASKEPEASAAWRREAEGRWAAADHLYETMKDRSEDER